ncbi:Histidine kinase-, DNA gyrase B-, and HSP90-like ATPase [Streptomyces sp. S4.7]|uniref:ATP-binding protein n=1 Tax=unclassified Streptomyces TaxID=2593676 RepID=UPI00139818F4|nr:MULTISPECIES: ATP-binding protein [unclassified Streptomyces]QHZ00228.1 Histidine kinase-, DNA gyrase B-, and HSP90-like ATPase [Streptomyces sp. S4.7]
MNGTRITDVMPEPGVVRGDSPAGIHEARDTARAFTGSLTPAPGSGVVDTIVLVVSELVTNALRHGGGRYTLELSAAPDSVTVAVSDPNPAPPRERAPDLDGGGGGFGWHMVRRLAGWLAIAPGPGPGPGKTIYAVLPR